MVKSSKRVTLKNKYKAQRKIKDHKHKVSKLAKLNPDVLQRRKKEDPGVPNLWPFKTAMLKDAENERLEAREKLERERVVKRAMRLREKEIQEESKKREVNDYQRENTVEGKRKWYFRELMKVVEASDVILEVLDARDPIGCRAFDVEHRIAGMLNDKGYPTKKVVLVLNKIDMVPPEVVNDWVTYLRREHPTIAFKASTHKHRGHMNRLDVKSQNASQKALDAKSSVGAPALLQLLKNYCRSQDLKKGLTVGIIGYPNVGKSSVVNSLKMMRAVQVSSNAGCTKTLQQVRLDSNIMLVDSPGVLFGADEDNVAGEEAQRGLLLRNALRLDQIEDPINAVQGILERCTTEQLMKLYSIAEFTSPHEFLIFVAHRRGKLGKGGVPQIDEAARTVIQDWNEGKIPFYTLPPVANTVQESVVVNKWSEEFDIDGLLDSANQQTVRTIYENGLNMHVGTDGMADENDSDEEAVNFDEEEGEMDDETYAQMYGSNSNLVVEESEEEENEEQLMKQAAHAAKKQERLHPIDMIPLRNLKVGRSKAAKVLDKDYAAEVAPALTKTQKKANAKKEKKKAVVVADDMGDSDFDYNEY